MFSFFKKWYNNKTFSKKIFYSYLFFCIIPFFIATIIASGFFVNVLSERTNSNIKDTNKKISVLLNNKLTQCEYVINNLICDPTFLYIVQERDNIMTAYEINNYLNEKITEMQISVPEIIEFTVFANSEFDNDSFKPMSELANNSNLSYAIIHEQSSTWYIEDGKVYAAYPIRDLYGKNLIGLISLHFDMHSLVKDYTDISLDEYGIYIFGSKGDNIYRKEAFSFEIGKITKRMLSASDEEFYTAGKTFISDKKEIINHGISVYCIVPKASVYKPIWNYLMIPLVVWIICLILVISLCLFMSKTLTKRVRLLESQMTRFSTGDLTVFKAEDAKDEIGNISRFCSEALVRLNQLINDNYISQIKLKDAKNKALIAQINPHFLYNTLNMIASQAIISENQIISDVITQLSNYYRTALNKGKNLISIEDEILNVKAYCNLQLRLHDYRFNITYDINEEIYHYTTTNLCLQPLVENAIEHGVNNLPDGMGNISISADLKDNTIIFTIKNNGASISDIEPNNYLNISTKGYGLKNIQDRINIVFGTEYGLFLTNKDGIFTATLKIPTQINYRQIEDFDDSDYDI